MTCLHVCCADPVPHDHPRAADQCGPCAGIRQRDRAARDAIAAMRAALHKETP